MMARENIYDRIIASFSDDVIGSVLTRSGPPKCYVADSNGATLVRSLQQQQFQYSSPTILPSLNKSSPRRVIATTGAKSSESHSPTTKLQCAGFSTASDPNYNVRDSVSASYPQQSSVAVLATNLPVQTVSDADANWTMNSFEGVALPSQRKWWASMKTDSCREQCRSNQARYRQKQRDYLSKLDLTVAQLCEEISTLEVQRWRLCCDSRQRVRDVVAEYFQLFRHDVGSCAFVQGSTHARDVLRASRAQQQLMFLRSTMAPDVKFGDVSGVEKLMRHWRCMSEYHENLDFVPIQMEKVSDNIVIATATLSVTITKTTLEYVFPHLVMSDNVDDLSLAVKLLGHKFDYPCTVLFLWDEETSLVVRMETDIDVILPFVKLFGNLKDASRVVEGAVMAPVEADL